MPEYLEDPSVLTKDKLKSELLANNVALPTGDQRKDVYVQLYLKNLTVQNKKIPSTDAFSSDEELPVPVVSNKSRSGRKATRKTDKPRPEDLDVTKLTSEGLKDELLKYGVNVGPIVATTRKLYERRLQKLLDHGPPETVTLPMVITQVDSNHNGNSNSDRYSDKEEEVTTVPEPEPVTVPVVERPVRSRGKTPVTTRTRSSQHNRVEKIAAGEQTPSRVDEKDVLKEMFPYETNTPTGINATCRRPIRGAAGRPLKSGDLWTDETLLRSTSNSSYSESRTATVHRVTTLPPSTRLVTSVTPPAGKAVAPPRGLPFWLKLLLLSVVAGFIFFVYQTMETNAMAPFGGSSDSTQTSDS
ncbi:thymopoietin a isoform X4 [Coregonus clupeaformis]|uniref:thymopoietin a isoform X4 n=1 Tax=Coregonus clupeaformis TaxID=59861 RepID=UPI001E1C2C08|nr:thymopoietin a isoform X4 [Coregonus clupeaformis]